VDPGERIKLIKGIADTLGSTPEYDWGDIDLVLEQFGIALPLTWSGSDPSQYVVAAVKDAKDERLQQLDEYLHPPDAGDGAEPDTRRQDASPQVADSLEPWQTDDFRLFISHCATVAPFAGQLRTAFQDRAIEAFVAHDTIQPTQEWEAVIRAALRSCDGLLAVLTGDFKDSHWTEQEVGFVVGRDKLVVSLRYGMDPHGFIGRYQAFTVSGGDYVGDIARKVFEALAQNERSRDRMAAVLVRRFARSGSFKGVRANFAMLQLIPVEAWSAELAAELRQACDENGEIKNGWIGDSYGPGAVNALLKQHGF
jgi:hypothetical protein